MGIWYSGRAMSRHDKHNLGEQLRTAGFHIPDYDSIQTIGRLGLTTGNFSAIFKYLEPRVKTLIQEPPFLSLIREDDFRQARRTDAQAILDALVQRPDYHPEISGANLICRGFQLSRKQTVKRNQRSARFDLIAAETIPPSALQQERAMLLDYMNVAHSQRREAGVLRIPMATIQGYDHPIGMLVAEVTERMPQSLTLGSLQLEPQQ